MESMQYQEVKLGSKYEIIRRIKQKEEEIVNAKRKEKKEEVL